MGMVNGNSQCAESGMRQEDCLERELVGVGWEGRTRARDGVETGGGGDEGGVETRVEMGGRDGSKTRLMMDEGKNKPRIRINASFTPDFRSKEGINNCFLGTVNQTWCNRACC